VFATFLGAGLALWTAAYVEKRRARREDLVKGVAKRGALRDSLVLVRKELVWNQEVVCQNREDARLGNALGGQLEARAWDVKFQSILSATDVLRSAPEVFGAYMAIQYLDSMANEYVAQSAGSLSLQRKAREQTLPRLVVFADRAEAAIVEALRAIDQDLASLTP
jgi:hypothetical protein